MNTEDEEKIVWRASWKPSELSMITDRQEKICDILKDKSIHKTEDEIIDYRKELVELEAQRRKILFESNKK